MSVQFEYIPLPIFEAFHASPEADRAVIGGYGSGKSTAGCAEVIALGLEQPGSEILVTRKTAPSLRDTTEMTFQRLLPPKFWDQCDVGRAGGHLEHVTFPNGTNYLFRAMDDWKKHRSMNLAFILWDEADEFTVEDFEGMQSRVRQTTPLPLAREQGHKRLTRRGNILACNPQGENWIYDHFVGPQRKANSAYFTSSSLDNPTLPLDTINRWLDMPDAWVKRFVLCSFEDFAGQIFEDWNYDTHVITPLTKYDPAGFHLMGFDPGTSSGNAALWVYYDAPNARLIGVAEYLETGLAAKVHAQAWRRIEAAHRMKIRKRIADPKAIPVRDRGSNVTLQEIYRRLGFRFVPGENSIPNRLASLGQLIHQGRFVVTTDCPQTYAQIKAYRWETLSPTMREKGKEAKPLKKDVDLVDAAEYLACAWLTPGRITADDAPQDPKAQDQQDIRDAIRKQLRTKRSATSAHDLGTIGV